ncbi:MAG: phosphatase PAP2 family protein [Lachnospiraceae bacterium]|jgi:membrane-associated phospholipid phosphatase|nr:phosphatase PAP2 family protein [Lachnospiraceae bacterium]MEE3461620.1 phosphatase PAP2 family protein [Lachnospiraceae bacterium]
MKKPETDLRRFRFSRLDTDEFRHLKWLIWWPFYGLSFLFVERFYKPPEWHLIYCRFDDMIPFCEYFLIPYMFWFVFMVGMLVYTGFYDKKCFTGMMKFIALTFTLSVIIYLIYPNYQNLRPDTFERNNIFTTFIKHFYQFDTDTNVCPSIHVIGSFATVFAAYHCKDIRSFRVKLLFLIIGILISISTVFLKQHSVIDIAGGALMCAFGYAVVYGRKH